MKSSSSSSSIGGGGGRRHKHHHRHHRQQRPIDPFQQARKCGLRENFPSLEEALQIQPSADGDDDDDNDHDHDHYNDDKERSLDNDEISVGSCCSSSSLNLSIGARAALNQHARHVAKYGIDGSPLRPSSSSSSSSETTGVVTGRRVQRVVDVCTDNRNNVSTDADTGVADTCSPTRRRLDEEWDRIVDGDVSHISLVPSSTTCLNNVSYNSSSKSHHSPRRRRHRRRHVEPIWRIDDNGHEAYELQAVDDEEEDEPSSESSIVSSYSQQHQQQQQEEHHHNHENISHNGNSSNAADDSFYSQSTTDYFNSSLVLLLRTPEKNQKAMQYHVVDSRRSRVGDYDDAKQQQQQQYQQEEESFTASTTQHDDDDEDDIYNVAIFQQTSQKEEFEVREVVSSYFPDSCGAGRNDLVTAVDSISTRDENRYHHHHHQDSSAESLLEMFQRRCDRHDLVAHQDIDNKSNDDDHDDLQDDAHPPIVLEEIELSRISSSGEEELYAVMSGGAAVAAGATTTTPSPDPSPIARRCFHQDSPIWRMDSQEDDYDGDSNSRGGGGGRGGDDIMMVNKPLSLPFLSRSPLSLLSSPIRGERQQHDLADCSFASSTIAELNTSINSNGRNSSSSSSSSAATGPQRVSPPRYPMTTRKEQVRVAGPSASSSRSSPVCSPLRCSTPPSSNRYRGDQHDLSLEPDLSALGLSPIAGRAADIAARLLRNNFNHGGSSSSSSNHNSRSRPTRRNKFTVHENDKNRSINHEISLNNNHGVSASALTSLAASIAERRTARVVSVSPNNQQSRSLNYIAASPSWKQNDSEYNEQSTTRKQQQQQISLLDLDTAHFPLFISPSNNSSKSSSSSSLSIKHSSCSSSSPSHGDKQSNQSLHLVPPTLDDSPFSLSSFSEVRDRRQYRSVVPFRVHMDHQSTDIPQEHDRFSLTKSMSATCLLYSFDQVAKQNNNDDDQQHQQNNRSSLSDPFPRTCKSSRFAFI